MTSDNDSNLTPDSLDAYSNLGLTPGATFDEVQKAREERLEQVGADPKARALIEASYDSVLMSSLKQRQLGNLSAAAANASQKEQEISENGLQTGSLFSFLPKFGGADNSSENGIFSLAPKLEIPNGQGAIVRLGIGLLAIFLILISDSSAVDLILPLSVLGAVISQIKRGRRILPALGWSVVSLSIGLMIGGLLSHYFASQYGSEFYLSSDQVEAIPAILTLLLLSLFLT